MAPSSPGQAHPNHRPLPAFTIATQSIDAKAPPAKKQSHVKSPQAKLIPTRFRRSTPAETKASAPRQPASLCPRGVARRFAAKLFTTGTTEGHRELLCEPTVKFDTESFPLWSLPCASLCPLWLGIPRSRKRARRFFLRDLSTP